MILPRPGKWMTAAGRFFIWERLYNIATLKPSILCSIRLRYYRILRDRTVDSAPPAPPVREDYVIS